MKKTLTAQAKEIEIALRGALVDAYCLIRGTPQAKSIIGKSVLRKIAKELGIEEESKDKIGMLCAMAKSLWEEKDAGLSDKEAREIMRDCCSRENPSDFEY